MKIEEKDYLKAQQTIKEYEAQVIKEALEVLHHPVTKTISEIAIAAHMFFGPATDFAKLDAFLINEIHKICTVRNEQA